MFSEFSCNKGDEDVTLPRYTSKQQYYKSHACDDWKALTTSEVHLLNYFFQTKIECEFAKPSVLLTIKTPRFLRASPRSLRFG